MSEGKKAILFIIAVVLLIGCVGYFVEYEVNKVIKSTDEISKSIYELNKHLHKA